MRPDMESADTMTHPGASHQIVTGASIYDRTGELMGILMRYDEQEHNLVVQQGIWFPKYVTVPLDAVAQLEQEAIYLR